MEIENNKLLTFIDRILPEDYTAHESTDNIFKARVFCLVVFITTPFYFFYALFYLFHDIPTLFFLVGFTAIATPVSLVIFLSTNNLGLSSFVFSLSTVFCLGYSPYFTGGLDSGSLLWYSVALLLISSFSSSKATIFWFFVMFINVFMIAYNDFLGIQITNLHSEKANWLVKFLGELGSNMVLFGIISIYLVFHKQNRNTLLQANHNTDEALRGNQNLLRLVSHDINNSLTVILTSMSLMRSEKVRSGVLPREKFEDKIDRASRKILEIINHVKEQQAIISGKKEIQLITVDLNDTVTHSIQFLTHQFENKYIEIDFHPSNKPLNIIAEPVSLENVVINNLITNAIKFSNQHSKIHFELSENSDFYVFKIEDYGIGMPREMVPRLFSFESSTSRVGTSGEPGTGFGMPLLKTYVELYGGKIEVSSRCISEFPNSHGTTFELYFKKASA